MASLAINLQTQSSHFFPVGAESNLKRRRVCTRGDEESRAGAGVFCCWAAGFDTAIDEGQCFFVSFLFCGSLVREWRLLGVIMLIRSRRESVHVSAKMTTLLKVAACDDHRLKYFGLLRDRLH